MIKTPFLRTAQEIATELQSDLDNGLDNEVAKKRIEKYGLKKAIGLEALSMTDVVLESCIKCKYLECVEVCPVDCFYEGENMLVIHPDECIDCGVCEPECPVEAIVPDTEDGIAEMAKVNAEYAEKWPNITINRGALPDADDFADEDGKYGKYFSDAPGQGD